MAKILIADDSETVRKMVQITLTSLGHAPILAFDGKDALELFRREPGVSLVITDINMPIMNGIELIKEIRKINLEIPILVLSTETEHTIRKQGADAGANGWITKPLKPLLLAEVLSKIL